MWEKPLLFIKPVLFNIWGFHIYAYGVGIAGALLVALFMFWRYLRRTSLSEEKSLDILFVSGVVGVGVGRLLYIVLNWESFRPTFLKVMLLFAFPGVDQLGFWFAFFITWFLYSLRHKLDFFLLMRTLGMPLLYGYTIFTFAYFFKEGTVGFLYGGLSVTVLTVLLNFFLTGKRQEKLPSKFVFFYVISVICATQIIIDFFLPNRIYLWGTQVLSIQQIVYLTVLFISLSWWGRHYFAKRKKATQKIA